jgi:phytoene synthase
VTTAAQTFDDQVRAADPDRWLSSRFVGDVQARADLMALYAFEAELLAIPTRVTQPMLAEMRYVWWRDQMDGVFSNTPRKGHPLLEALTDMVARRSLDRAPFDALIEAHIGRVHSEPHDLEAFYVGPMQTAVQILAGAGFEAQVIAAGRAWGLFQVGRDEEARALKSDANRALKGLPTAAFPAVLHLAAVAETGEGMKRLRMIWASLTGRV